MIVLSGQGCVTGFGVGVAALRNGINRGASALTHSFEDKFAYARSDVPSLDRPDRCAQLLEIAINEALDDARITEGEAPVPVILGSTHGELGVWEKATAHDDNSMPQMPKLNEAAWGGRARQTSYAVTTACTASSHALAMAVAAIRAGRSDCFVVAGGDVVADFLLQGFKSLRALSREGCTPFAKGRDGISLGEGAAAVVVETDARAKARGATILASVKGIGNSTDAYSLTAPDPSGLAMSKAIKWAMGGAETPPDIVNVHGTGSDLNDRMEYFALARHFGDQLKNIEVSATKHATGHTCGAAAALELIICTETLAGRMRPNIMGTEVFDPRFPMISGQQKNTTAPRTALSMNCAFGGSNTAVLLERVAA